MEILTLCISVLTIIINTIPYAATRADRKAVVSSKLIIQRNLINYRNASNKRPGAYLISKVWGGCLFDGGAYIIASILHEIHICNMQELCHILTFNPIPTEGV